MADCNGDGESSELLNFSVPAHLDSIAAVGEQIAATLERLNLPEEKRMEISLAVQEALVNAVVHGCNSDPSKKIACHMEGNAHGCIVITVSDPGPGFDPEKLPDPQRPDRIFQEHGRGVYLIRHLMDSVQFERGGREIRMWKY